MTVAAPLTCPKCQADLKDDLALPGAAKACPACSRPVEGLIFPSYYRAPSAGKTAEALVATEDAGCFYHPQSRAQVPCDACGRFLCALCDIELQGQHLCPACVNMGRKKRQIRQLDEGRVLYGGMAAVVSLLPLLIFWPLSIITGPLSVFIAIYGWRKPQSITGARRLSYVIAIILGLAQTGAWVFFGASLFKVI